MRNTILDNINRLDRPEELNSDRLLAAIGEGWLGIALRSDRRWLSHVGADCPRSMVFLIQAERHSPRAVERPLQIELVDPTHQSQIVG